jgi:hypothetical protein
MPPPKILQIFREQIKPGKETDYRRIEEDASVICRKMHCPNPYLALTSISGMSETWFVNGYDSSRTLAKVWEDYGQNTALLTELNGITAGKADIVFPGQTMFTHFREDFSQSAGWDIGRARFFSITTVQVRPGHIDDYEEIQKTGKGTEPKGPRCLPGGLGYDRCHVPRDYALAFC